MDIVSTGLQDTPDPAGSGLTPNPPAPWDPWRAWTCSFPHAEPQWHTKGHGDPLLPAPLSHPWDGAVLGAKGPPPPQDYEICLGGGGSSSGVPKPARCPGRLPAPARPTPATGRNTQKAPVYCSPGGAGGPQGNGGQDPPPTNHHFGSPGPKLSRAAFSQLSSPSKPGFGERSIAPQPLPPRDEPRQDGGVGASGRGTGCTGGQGKHRGALGGQQGARGPCQLPQHCHTKVWGMGGCARAPSAQPRCPPRLHPQPPRGDTNPGQRPPERERGSPPGGGGLGGPSRTPELERNRTKNPPSHSQERLGKGGSEGSGATGTPRTPRGDSGRWDRGGDGPGFGVPRASRGGRDRASHGPTGPGLGSPETTPTSQPDQDEGVQLGGGKVQPRHPRGIPAGAAASQRPPEAWGETLSQLPGAPRPPARGDRGVPPHGLGAAPPELLSLGVSGVGQEAAGPPPFPGRGGSDAGAARPCRQPGPGAPQSIPVGAGNGPLP